MSQLVHWEATRDAIRARLASEVGDSFDSAELDGLSATLANVAIEAYTKSILTPATQPHFGGGP